jgi:N-methylhydantoinase B/oxoprolinase/acetone carboxylase alpha subunit
MVYGFPAGRTSTQTTPYYTNPTATALGTGLLGFNVFNAANQATGGGLSNAFKGGWNWLTSGFGSPSQNDYGQGYDVSADGYGNYGAY